MFSYVASECKLNFLSNNTCVHLFRHTHLSYLCAWILLPADKIWVLFVARELVLHTRVLIDAHFSISAHTHEFVYYLHNMGSDADERCLLSFTGYTHDHSVLPSSSSGARNGARNDAAQHSCTCSTIAILRRHPMHDSLVLVKKFRACLNACALEFPTSLTCWSEASDASQCGDGEENNASLPRQRACCGKLVSRFFDGDDPIEQGHLATATGNGNIDLAAIQQQQEPQMPDAALPAQFDERGEPCELVMVPINGLLDRLKNYTAANVAVDSRVYSFAMGLKTAERILTTSALKELQEAPI